jgi:hypothetical protein
MHGRVPAPIPDYPFSDSFEGEFHELRMMIFGSLV